MIQQAYDSVSTLYPIENNAEQIEHLYLSTLSSSNSYIITEKHK